MTEQATSPKARQYEQAARDFRASAAKATDEDIRRYFISTAESYERKARHAQENANRRKYLRDHPEVREARIAADAEIRHLEREAKSRRSR